MKTRNLRLALMLSLPLLSAACTEETILSGPTATEGREATVRITVSAAPVGVASDGTRTIPDDMDEGSGSDYMVKDFWVMEFDDAGNRIGTPQYYTKGDLTDENNIAIPVILPGAQDKEYKCVVVANTHSDNLAEAMGEANTIDELMGFGRKVSREEDLCNPVSKDLLMNSVMTIRHDTKSLDCKLYRNVAKLTLHLNNNAGSGVKVNSVQICNVTGTLFYADRLYDGAEAPSPAGVTSFMSLEAEETVIKEGESETFTYYLPRNCRGNNSSTLATQKNNDVPSNATYIEIIAEDIEKNTPLRYRFYPGENMTNNFDITPNRHYILPVTIAGKGDAVTDSRVEDLSTLILPESNCYIVNPLSGSTQTLHAVPLSRINKFWSSEDGLMATDGDNTIKEGTVWVAEVIWQDADKRLIDFCDKDGKILEGDTYTGTGNSYFRFKPRAGARGNVLVGVRRESASKESYLWSWHLWITDYNPDRKASWEPGIYKYHVIGGSVFRLASGASDGKGFWDLPENENKYVMDRNLGAMGCDDTHYEESCGLYYQHGRKDPFPNRNAKLYDINGNELPDIIKGAESTYLHISVKQPNRHFGISGKVWLLDDKYKSNRWRNPTWNKEGSTKSIFDPSPPGWKIPYRTGQIANCIWGVFTLKGNLGYYSIKRNGLYFYVSGTGSGETTWVPFSGQFTINGMAYLNSYGWHWFSNEEGIFFRYYSPTDLLTQGSRTSTVSIRCVQE